MFISVDPGFTSGTCIADRIFGDGSIALRECIEIAWIDRMRYYDLIVANAPEIDAIIIEDFKLTGDPKKLRTQRGSRMPSSQVIAILETAAYSARIFDRIVYQEPADRWSLSLLPEHYAIIGTSDHNKAAYKHMRYYARLNRRKYVNR